MLPFLKQKRNQDAGGAIMERAPDNDNKESDSIEGIKACAAELIKAVHARDEAGVARAITDAFAILDSLPHEEGPHTYEDQK